jgi:hypothetical protein
MKLTDITNDALLNTVQTYSDLLAKALHREGVLASHEAFTFWVLDTVRKDIDYYQAMVHVTKAGKLTNHEFNTFKSFPLIKTEWDDKDVKKARCAFAEYFGVEPEVLNYDCKTFEVSGQVGNLHLYLECDINVNIKGWRVTK